MTSPTPNYVPHVAFDEREHRYYVRARTGPGEYVLLTEFFAGRRWAQRELRRIRREMVECRLSRREAST